MQPNQVTTHHKTTLSLKLSSTRTTSKETTLSAIKVINQKKLMLKVTEINHLAAIYHSKKPMEHSILYKYLVTKANLNLIDKWARTVSVVLLPLTNLRHQCLTLRELQGSCILYFKNWKREWFLRNKEKRRTQWQALISSHRMAIWLLIWRKTSKQLVLESAKTKQSI